MGWKAEVTAAHLAIPALAAACTVAMHVSCISPGRPYPLYSPIEPRLPASRVALLSGYIRYIDDRDISESGGVFEMLPGCHRIGTPSYWGVVGNTGGTVATTGRWEFAIPMRAGFRYKVAVETNQLSGAPTGQLAIRAYENDASGNRTRTFERTANTAELHACQTEAAQAPP